ncbi:VOC family protein [Ohtaekwangia sp.]|uniref:VOC family protein n=1 Tax=Ohtaekwangia sp. TaxID=2066019 RepID=UPI002F91E488
MNLSSIRVITGDIKRLVQFYENVTDQPFTWYTDDFAELRTSSGALAIGSTRTLAFFGGSDIASAASNKSVIIEFYIDNVDDKYKHLANLPDMKVVQAPTTMPWGNRSLLLRDPDGNLVNLFTPVTQEAQKRFSGMK